MHDYYSMFHAVTVDLLCSAFICKTNVTTGSPTQSVEGPD